MQQRRAYTFQLKTTSEQERLLRCFAGSCRFVYNQALVLQNDRYAKGEKRLSYAALCKVITDWRHVPETLWLSESPIHALQQSVKDLDRAYVNFFTKRASFPRFKKKGQRDSFRFPDHNQIKLDQANSRIFLPKLGWLRYRNSRDVLGAVKSVTVSLASGKWGISIQTERNVDRATPSGHAVGIDMGISRFATLSDGTFLEPLNSFKKHRAILCKAQRAMSRKHRFSQNWKKAKARVQRVQIAIANTRKDFLHKASTTISKNHAMVCLEDLHIRNLSRSASGTIEQPGRNVRAKAGLNRSILDQGWCEFRRQLAYKLDWRGGLLVAVPPAYTSQACPSCGHISADNRKTQDAFRCVKCGYSNHADLVGAMNILAAGHAVLVCGESALGRSMKQEPAEATQPLPA